MTRTEYFRARGELRNAIWFLSNRQFAEFVNQVLLWEPAASRVKTLLQLVVMREARDKLLEIERHDRRRADGDRTRLS